MDDLLSELELTNVKIEALQICLDERENYSGPILFNLSNDVIENISLTCSSIKKSTSSTDFDVLSLKKLAMYINCLIYQSSDPNGMYYEEVIYHMSHPISLLYFVII